MAVSSPSDPRPGGQIHTEWAAEKAAEQFGAIARRQLIARGCSKRLIESWLRRGLLHPRYPGVYAWGRDELSTEGELAAGLLYAGEGSALTGLTQLWWMELLGTRPHRITLAAPGHVRSRFDLDIRHPRCFERRVHRGLPVTPLADALLLAAAALSHNSLRLVLARADFRDLLNLGELHAALGRGRTGSAAVTAALGAHLPALARCANRLEREFVLLCERERVEIPEPNVRIGRWVPDMLWREAMLIVELDGRDAHSSPAQLAADRERQAALEALGYTVDRYDWDGVMRTPGAVAAAVRARLR